VKTKHSLLGFTLIEILTVIAIIVILMSLLMPTFRTAKIHAQLVVAQKDLKQIDAAVAGFAQDYGSYPVPPNAQITGTGVASNYTYGDPVGSGAQSTNNYLFDVLRAFQGSSATKQNVLAENPRLVSYMDLPYVKDPNNPKSGIATQATSNIPQYSFVDPWGQQYNVRVDASNANQVYFTPPYINPSLGVNYLNTGVISWSYGPDGAPGAGGNGDMTAPNFDDMLSWQ